MQPSRRREGLDPSTGVRGTVTARYDRHAGLSDVHAVQCLVTRAYSGPFPVPPERVTQALVNVYFRPLDGRQGLLEP